MRTLAYLTKLVGVALLYFLTARLGLKLDAVGGVATAVWPPTGISLAALLLLGKKMWPGIFLGAFSANFSVGEPWGVALGISVGNTLEALLGAYGLKRWVHFENSMERLRDVLGLIGIAAILSTAVSATIGAISAWWGGVLASASLASAWGTWWLGDLMGDLVVAPFFLTVSSTAFQKFSLRKASEFFLLFLSLTVASQIIFGEWFFGGIGPHAFIYLVFPLLIWSALRFGPRGAATAVLLVSGLAIWNTTQGRGPFTQTRLNENLLSLQSFLGVIAGTTLLLAAAFLERKRAEGEAKKANLDLQRLSQLKSEFASIVAHELKTPLTIIKEGIGMVLDGIDGPVNEQQRETLGLARDNVNRLGRLIDNVLDYEKLETGKLEFHFEWTDLRALTQEVFQFMELMGRQKSILWHLDLPQNPVLAYCDPDKIKEILINLIDNGFKHTPRGGEIWIRLIPRQEKWVFEVQDTGLGIRKEDQQKIFQIFRKAPSHGEVKVPGSGIGLAVCKLLVETHQGRISLESELKKGCKFIVEIPLQPPSPEAKRETTVTRLAGS
jgi:Signal transduction histidine kinase